MNNARNCVAAALMMWVWLAGAQARIDPRFQTLDGAGGFSALATSSAVRPDGRPLLTYTQFLGDSTSLALYRCDEPACFNGAVRRVQSKDFPGAATILIRSNGRPLVIYVKGGDLAVFDCEDEDCSVGVENTLVEGPSFNDLNLLDEPPQAALNLNGLPVIVYTEADLSLSLVQCNEQNCASGSKRSLGAAEGQFLIYPRIAMRSDGRLLLTYLELDETETSATHRLYDCADIDCTTGSAYAISPDGLAVTPGPVNLSTAGGQQPLLSYVTEDDSVVLYFCANSTCSSGIARTVIHDVNNIEVTPVVLRSDGIPGIVYYSPGSRQLTLFRCTNVFCEPGILNIVGVEQVIENNVGDLQTAPSLSFLADGSPVVHYHDEVRDGTGQYELNIIICDSAECAAPVSNVLLGQRHAVGSFNSLAIGPQGRAAVSYRDESSDDLKIYVCDDPECISGFGRRLDGQGGNNAGQFSSIAFRQNGRPIISYQASDGIALGIYDCADIDCNEGVSHVVEVGVVNGTSVAVRQDGRPIVSFFRDSVDRLAVYDCLDVGCATGVTHTLTSEFESDGRFSSIAIRQDGRPIISYFGGRTFGTQLLVFDCANVACSEGTARVLDDSSTIVGKHTSIAVRPNGLPFISYTDQSKLVIKGYDCHDVSCSSGTIRQLSDDLESLGGSSNRLDERTTSVAISPDGRPIVSYFSYGDDLRVYKCADVQCTDGDSEIVAANVANSGRYNSVAVRADGRKVLSYDQQGGRLGLLGDLPPLLFRDSFE